MDTIRLDAFRVAIGITLLLYMLERWRNAGEWLTSDGFHFSSKAAYWYAPLTFPPLPELFLVWFGFLLFFSICAMILGWKTRWATLVLLCCFVYVCYVDFISFFTLNILYLFSLTVFLLAPEGASLRVEKGGDQFQVPWAIRIIQITIVLQYFLSGIDKILYGDWHYNPYVLWSHGHGNFRTAFAAWMVNNIPRWAWSIMQYSALSFELVGPILFLIRRCRIFAFLWGFGFHTMVDLTMHQLIFFSFQIMCFYIVFMEESFLHNVRTFLKRITSVGLKSQGTK